MGFLGSYSKTFGQIYIADDAFLAAAATVQNFVNGGGRILWGFVNPSVLYQYGRVISTSRRTLRFDYQLFYLLHLISIYITIISSLTFHPCFPEFHRSL